MTLRERVAVTAGWERWALAACAVVAVGALLPWASFLGASVYGIEGDGVITLIAAAAATALVLWRRHPALAAVLGVVVLVVGFVDWTRLAAVGLYLTVIGGAGIVAAAAMGLRVRTAKSDA